MQHSTNPIATRPLHRLVACLLALWCAAVAPTQTPPAGANTVAARIAAVDRQMVAVLLEFARTAEANKLPSRALRAYQEVVDCYDSTNTAALRGLGWRQVQGNWEAPASTPPAVDQATPEQKKRVDQAWQALQAKATRWHRVLGIALLAEQEATLGTLQLERALAYSPDDEASHRALGHEAVDGFYGTEDELALVRRMRALFTKANELRRLEVPVAERSADSLPGELLATRMRFFGAASKHFEYWVVEDRSAPARCAAWAERGLLLAEYLVGTGTGAKVLDATRQRWAGYVRNDLQRDRLLATAPAVLGNYTVEQMRLLGGQQFTAARGLATVSWHEAALDADRTVSHVLEYCLLHRSNAGLGEGVVHLASWLLCGTMITSFMELARTSSGQEVHLPEVGDAWLKLLQDEIAAGRDVPLVQVPREPIANFRPGVRLKSWGFMLWLVCRCPDTWFELVEKLSTDTTPTPEQVASAFETVLGRGVDEVEAEWRAWAKRGSRLGRASGFGR
jgi:hypothetical protein